MRNAVQFKLANIVLETDAFLAGHEDLLYGSTNYGGQEQPQFSTQDECLTFSGVLDLFTYFNAFSLAKWRQYTSLENLHVHLELCGSDCDIVLACANAEAAVQADVVCNMYASNEWQSFDIPIALDNSVLVGLQLASGGSTKLRNAFFYTEVDPAQVRPVRIALATTTFNNEDYICPNIELVKQKVLGSAEPIASAFHMFVVDNGRTLDAAALSGEGVSVLSNPNVGGAGGFARGMLEALGEGSCGAPEYPFTHVLLMDDDVHVFPESFIRTFNLLSLANAQYQDAFVQGAMLKLQEPNLQYEDVAYVKRTGGYERLKQTFDVSQLVNMVANETTSVEREQTYGAWWYSCIPVSAIEERGLPLPFFIRIDDVEFGVRQPATYMTLGGICVWHAQFVGRFKASVDLYQYGRNMLVAIASSNIASMQAFMAKYWRNFQIYLRFMDYSSADLWLDALEDYLRGPAWLAAVNGEQLIKANAQKNEKLVPLDQLDQQVLAQTDINMAWIGNEETPRNPVLKALEGLPYSRHLLPNSLLKDQPASIDYSWTLSPWQATARRKTLVALDATGENGHVRKMDRIRYWQLMRRYATLRKDLVQRGKQVAQEYRQARAYLTSSEFWKEYLGL